MNIKTLIFHAIVVCCFITTTAWSEQNNESWFEVEVILLQQLSDKSQLKEAFSITTNLTKYGKSIDLLASYLHPDISVLKQLLPHCDQPEFKPSLMQQKSLFAIFNQSSINNNQDNELNTIMEPIANINASWNEKTEQQFQTLKFPYTDNSFINNFEKLCIISESEYSALNINNNLKYNELNINKIPKVINATQNSTIKKTHLLNTDDLQLKDIISDLKYSKQFRPILHLGWRQIARSKHKATGIKIYAGDNYLVDYQQRLKAYNAQQLRKQRMLTTTPKQLTAEEDAIKDVDDTKNKIQQLIKLTLNVENELEQNNITSIENYVLASNILDKNQHQSILANEAPKIPLQQWFVEGYLKIHLNHYLYINADFSILDKSLTQLATERTQAKHNSVSHNVTIVNRDTEQHNDNNIFSSHEALAIQAKAIPFKQFRRVISGEIHYFDHPYLGMIVQIRPYSKPEKLTKTDELPSN